MAGYRDSKYRAIKGAVTLQGEGTPDEYAFFYALIDNGNVHRVGARMPDAAPPVNIKTEWLEFCAYIEGGNPSTMPPVVEILRVALHRTLLDSKLASLTLQNALAVQDLEKRANDAIFASLRSTRAHTFAKVENCSEEQFRNFLAQFATKGVAAESGTGGEPMEVPEGDAPVEPESPEREVTIVCQPIIDPIRGKPAVMLLPGETMIVRLPEDSLIFSMMSKARGGFFDGAVEGLVARVERRSEESSVVEIQLAQGVRGLVSLHDSLRVRMAQAKPNEMPAFGQGTGAQSHFALWGIVAGAALFFAALIFLLLR